MLSFDTLKIAFPSNCILNMDQSRFYENYTVIQGSFSTSKRIYRNLGILGINSLMIENSKNKAILEFSAKILGKQYLEGINLNTIENALRNCNKTGVANLHIQKTIESSTIFRCDVVKNFNVHGDLNTEIHKLSTLGTNPFFKVETHGNKSVIFTKRSKYRPIRLIFYQKYLELCQKKNASLLKVIDAESTLQQVRAELNLRNFDQMRQLLCVENNDLQSALSSQADPIKTVFSKIKLDSKIQFIGHRTPYELPFKELKKRIGWEGIIGFCKTDPGVLHSFLKTFEGINISRYMAEARPILLEMLARDRGGLPGKAPYCELENLILAA